MSTFIFILGRDRELSLAELFSVYPKAELKGLGGEFVVLNLKADFKQTDLDRLGGVIKVAKLTGSVNFKGLEQAVFDQINQHYTGNKFNYGVSVYDWPLRNLRTLLVGLKKRLKKEGVKSRFANQNFKNLSAAQYKGLKGVEWVVAKDVKCLLLGEVVAVQNIDAYSKRDFDKPFRDMQMGMLPPKLAQILINLTGVRGAIWDPFCGSGTVLMEGLLSGHDMIGSDIEKKHVEGAKKNVDWLSKNFELRNTNYELFVHDATKPTDRSFDAVAAEVDLGIPHGRQLSEQIVKDQVKDLDDLYLRFFKALKQIEFRGPVVVALPFFRPLKGGEVEMSDTVRSIKKLGFEQTALLPQGIGAERFQLKYARPSQAVGRMVYRFQLS